MSRHNFLGALSLPPVKGGAVEEYVYQLARHLKALRVVLWLSTDLKDDKPVVEEVGGTTFLKCHMPRFTFPHNIYCQR